MPYTFKTLARAADVMMLQSTGDHVLAILGRPVSGQGVITVEQIPAAIAALAAAANGEPPPPAPAPADTGERPAEVPVSLHHRFGPLIELLQLSRAANKDVTWGI